LERIRFWTNSGAEAPEAASWTDSALVAEAAEWLGPFLRAAPASGNGAVIDETGLRDALRSRLGWKRAAAFDTLVPEHLTTPAGSSRAVDYSSGEPVVEVRIQEIFGLAETPRILGLPVVLRLLSPGSRPLQTTKDLGSFWRGTWTEIRKEMRGRYPRHYWPEDPLVAEPTTRAKPRQK
jgi:ATP-dependent helicase HrpB